MEDFVKSLDEIWSSKWLTNKGKFHNQLEKKLAQHLDVDYCSLFCNGTLALLCGLKAMKVSGEVVTTPFSFPATTHVLPWNGNVPVFSDIDPSTGNLDPQKAQGAINSRTGAVLPVHVYGCPCDVDYFSFISNKYGIPVIYDAAHAFGVKFKGRSVLSFGAFSIVSFHATKIFNTLEGGLLVTRSRKLKERVDSLKNFGITNEVTVTEPGINAKLNEFQAALGLLQLQHIDRNMKKARQWAEHYRRELEGVKGVSFLSLPDKTQWNYSYSPVLIDAKAYGESRDSLCQRLKRKGVYARRYFYPLISEGAAYSALPSSRRENLPLAFDLSRKVLCLPLYPDLTREEVERVLSVVKRKRGG